MEETDGTTPSTARTPQDLRRRWRCGRMDGKKWRCARDAEPDQRYCQRHLNRAGHATLPLQESSSKMQLPCWMVIVVTGTGRPLILITVAIRRLPTTNPAAARLLLRKAC
jgi:hypothetical protein